MEDSEARATSAAMPSEAEPAGGDIQVIARVVALLECLEPDTPYLDTPTTARVLGVGRSTAHRYLASLEKHGLLQRRTATSYELGPALRRLGTLALTGIGVVEAAGPVMRELAREVRSTVVLSVWGGRAPVVARVVPDTSRVTTISVEVGRSLPPEAAQARVFAAYQRNARRRGAASLGGLRPVEDDGLVPVGGVLTARHAFDGGVKTLAAPVRTPDGAVVATLAVIGLALHMPDAEDDAVAESLVAAASRIPAT